MRNIKLYIQYDGTNYCGWQIQPNTVSIQGLIQDAIGRMTGEETVLVGASRTDAGVHALGQVAHFRTSKTIPCDAFKKGINSILPENIVITGAEDTDESFHARKGAKGKRYCYLVLVSRERRPMFRNKCWQLNKMPDIEAIQKAAASLGGEHDFSSFRAAGSSSRDAVRRLDRIEIKKVPLTAAFDGGREEGIVFEFIGSGFLRHMIRNIVGLLIDVGFGKIDPTDVRRILNAHQRKEAGICAPASGLYLVEVFY